MKKLKKRAIAEDQMQRIKGGTQDIWSVDAGFRLRREFERHPLITNDIWTSQIK